MSASATAFDIVFVIGTALSLVCVGLKLTINNNGFKNGNSKASGP
jgi:hypothetical protein